MEILHLIEGLENLAVASPRVPMVGKVMIDPQELLDLVDRMRIALPESVREAQRLLDEHAAHPQWEQSAISSEAKAKLDNHQLVKMAEQRAREIISQAEREAARLLDEARRQSAALAAEAEAQRRGADEYARGVLTKLESQLEGMLSTIRRGLEVLEREREGEA